MSERSRTTSARTTVRNGGRPSARSWARRPVIPDPRDFVFWFASLVRRNPGIRVVIYARVSGRDQARRGGLKRQIQDVRGYVEAWGGVVIAEFRDPATSGWAVDDPLDRPGFVAAAECAVAHNAVVVGANVSRFIRAADFNTNTNPDAQANEGEWASLIQLAGGAVLATILHPSADPETIAQDHNTRNARIGGNVGGRPLAKQKGWTIERHDRLMPKIRRCLADGKSRKGTAKKFGIPWTTFRDWLERDAEGGAFCADGDAPRHAKPR